MDKGTGGAYGLLIYHPSGAEFLISRRLIVEFTLNVVQALLAAILLSWASGIVSYAGRVGFVFLVGLVAALSTNIEYWNWLNFPANYTAGYISTQIIGFLLIGLVVAALVKANSGTTMVQSVAAG